MEFVYETTKLLNSPKGVLHIVNNYTGDRLAFEQGREMCETDGIKVETLLVNDDVAVKDSTWTVGRRGVAGNFFVIKAVGAASEKGASLEELVRIGNEVIANVRTLGIALSSCTPPVKGTPLFDIADDEMEVGIGIHGEPGRQRTKLVSANEIVDIMLNAIVPDLPFKSGDEVALMINGLGGTPIGELYVLYGIAHKKLEAQGIKVFRSYVNEYCTSLEMAGASLTLLKVDEELKGLLLRAGRGVDPGLLIGKGRWGSRARGRTPGRSGTRDPLPVQLRASCSPSVGGSRRFGLRGSPTGGLDARGSGGRCSPDGGRPPPRRPGARGRDRRASRRRSPSTSAARPPAALPESESREVRRVIARAVAPATSDTPATGGVSTPAAPKRVAELLPPRKPANTGQECPTTAPRPAAAPPARPQSASPSRAAAAPLPMSRASVTAAGPRPAVRRTLAIPIAWLP